jgi:magnesium-transporting ATPase (P-type)
LSSFFYSSAPSFGLGLEKAEVNVMRRPPHSMKTGVFTWPVVIDCFVYGIAMGAACMISVSHAHGTLCSLSFSVTHPTTYSLLL